MDVERAERRDVQEGLGQDVPIRGRYAQVGLQVSQALQEILLQGVPMSWLCFRSLFTQSAVGRKMGSCPDTCLDEAAVRHTSRALTGLNSLLLSRPRARAACATGEGCGTFRLPLGRSGCVTTAATCRQT